MQEYYKAVLKSLENFKFRGHLQTVFRDVIHALALRCAIKTDLYRNKERQEEYKITVEKYRDMESQFIELMDSIIQMLKNSFENFGDHLGHIYMQLAHNGNNIGQFFTPYHISKLMVQMTMANHEEELKDKEYLSFNDPCCGAGGMLIAVCDYFHEKKINYTQHAIIYGNDIDLTCVEMTYLQLSFIGASAFIELKCTFKQEQLDCYRTLGYLLRNTKNDKQEVAITHTETNQPKITHDFKDIKQIDLFDLLNEGEKL